MEFSDILTVLFLVVLEGALSADNALVLAVLVLPLPPHQQKKALQYGIFGAFFFRIVCIYFAQHLIAFNLAKLIGSLYLFYLPIKHFFRHVEAEENRYIPPAKAMLGMSLFWSVVTRVELTDIVFAIDSILVAVAVSTKMWVIITGGILGVIAIRVVIGKLLGIIQRLPAIVDGAYIIVAWVAIKLLVEYLHGLHWIQWQIPRWFSLSLIGLIFVGSLFYARKKRAAEVRQDAKAKEILEASDLTK